MKCTHSLYSVLSLSRFFSFPVYEYDPNVFWLFNSTKKYIHIYLLCITSAPFVLLFLLLQFLGSPLEGSVCMCL